MASRASRCYFRSELSQSRKLCNGLRRKLLSQFPTALVCGSGSIFEMNVRQLLSSAKRAAYNVRDVLRARRGCPFTSKIEKMRRHGRGTESDKILTLELGCRPNNGIERSRYCGVNGEVA